MTPANLARHRNSPNLPFWRMLKVGNDHFETSHLEPKVDVCDRTYVFDALPPANASKPLVFDPGGKCPAFVVDRRIERAALEKQRADDAEYAQLVRDNVPTVPVYTGFDGSMNAVFIGQFPGRYVSFAKVLPPGELELPRLPPVPWADSNGSLTSVFFGGLFGSNADSQPEVASTASAIPERGTDLAPAAAPASH
jgi:hypothetical protein